MYFSMTSDKRRSMNRVPVRVPATLQFHVPKAGSVPVLGVVLDLNERGAMVSAELPSQICHALSNQQASCELDFSGMPSLPVTVIATAVWNQAVAQGSCTIYHIGFFFDKLHDGNLTLLRKFIDSRLESGGGV